MNICLLQPPSPYDYALKTCRYCGKVFKPASGVQTVCFQVECRKQRNKDRWDKKREKYRSQIYADNLERYYRNKTLHQNGDIKPCDCGCGIMIPMLTAKGKHNKFYRGHFWKGKKMPEWVCQKWSERQKTLLENPTYMKQKMQRLKARPNGLELIVIGVIEHYDIPLKYVGDGDFVVGRFNPDFINEERKIIVEVFGDYWHTLDIALIKDVERKQTYENAGYRLLILWEKDIRKMSPQQIATILFTFIGGDDTLQ